MGVHCFQAVKIHPPIIHNNEIIRIIWEGVQTHLILTVKGGGGAAGKRGVMEFLFTLFILRFRVF